MNRFTALLLELLIMLGHVVTQHYTVDVCEVLHRLVDGQKKSLYNRLEPRYFNSVL